MDGTIPRRCLPDVLDRIMELSAEYGLTVGNVFHAGDGNIHPCIFYDASKPGELERAEEFGGRISPDYMCMDSTIPRKRLADMLLAIQQMETKYNLRCANVFHAGDGNLHPLILFDANDPDQLHRCELFGADILETSVAMGGTVTGEHGVGIEKLGSMCVQFSPEEREQMFAIKRAFDPAELLNPGKVIPLLSRCAEYGKMHVKKGLLPFPDLPRF